MPSQLAYYEFMGYSSDVLRERYAMYAARFRAGDVVADIGCGRGEFLDLLRARGVDGVGVDPDPDMAAHVRGRGFEVVEAGGVEFLESRRGSLDGVFAAHLVEHLPPDEVEALIVAAGQSLRPGGRLILVTPNPRNLEIQLREFWVDLQHVRFYSPDILRWLLHRCDLADIESGENPAYAAGPVEIRTPFEPLAQRRTEGTGNGWPRWNRITELEERLLELERRMDRVMSWIQSLYPPGEYYVTGVRLAGAQPEPT